MRRHHLLPAQGVTKSDRRRKGFSLPETLVGLSIALVVLGGATALYVFYRQHYVVGNAYLDVSRNASQAVEAITHDALWARSLEPAYGAYTTGTSCVILKVPSIDASGVVVPDSYDRIIYLLSSGSLQRIVVPVFGVSARESETRACAENIISLEFGSGGTLLGSIADVSTLEGVTISVSARSASFSVSSGSTKTANFVLKTGVHFRNKR